MQLKNALQGDTFSVEDIFGESSQGYSELAITSDQGFHSTPMHQDHPQSCNYPLHLTKENPAKGRVSRLLFGRVALFPLREETLLTDESCLRNLAGQAPTYQLVD